MDYVYICRSGDNEELRYSIRSIVKYAHPDNIWVVGGKPEWYSGNYIEVEDTDSKFQNINKCYKAIINEDKISQDFVLMNDDFFTLCLTGHDYRYFSGLLQDKINTHAEKHGNSSYARALKGALKELVKRGIEEPLNYDVHTPMTFNKALLTQVIDLSLAPRSMYGNMFIRQPVEMMDVKLYKDTSDINFDSCLISTEDNSFKLIKDRLAEMFMEPTSFEK